MSRVGIQCKTVERRNNRLTKCPRVHPPEDDQVHPCLVSIIVFLQTGFSHCVELVYGLDFLIDPLIRLQVWVHIVTKHQTAQIFLNKLWQIRQRVKTIIRQSFFCFCLHFFKRSWVTYPSTCTTVGKMLKDHIHIVLELFPDQLFYQPATKTYYRCGEFMPIATDVSPKKKPNSMHSLELPLTQIANVCPCHQSVGHRRHASLHAPRVYRTKANMTWMRIQRHSTDANLHDQAHTVASSLSDNKLFCLPWDCKLALASPLLQL